MSDTWIIGQVVRFSVALTDASGAAADPGTLTLNIKPPGSAVAAYAYGGGTVLRSATGMYYADIALTEFGEYRWRWDSAAPNAGADQGTLQVEPSII